MELYVINNVFQPMKYTGDGRFIGYFSRTHEESITMFCCFDYGKICHLIQFPSLISSLEEKMNVKCSELRFIFPKSWLIVSKGKTKKKFSTKNFVSSSSVYAKTRLLSSHVSPSYRQQLRKNSSLGPHNFCSTMVTQLETSKDQMAPSNCIKSLTRCHFV